MTMLQPVLAMMLLTLLVWIFMYYKRFGYIISNKMDASLVATPEMIVKNLPVEVNWSSNNLKNLFELPVIFYALCGFLEIAGMADQAFVTMAWAYVGLRAVHSIVQCLFNIVPVRFAAYLFSSLVLWVMVGCTALKVF